MSLFPDPTTLSGSALYAPLFRVPAMAEIFSDECFVANMLHVEAALARAQGKLGVIPTAAADAISEAVRTLTPDFAALQAGTERAGLPVIDLVRQLRQQLRLLDPSRASSASYVHWGATTQDIMDTALVLQIRAGLRYIERELLQLIEKLAALADRHRNTLMAGRTHSQQALPITFGLKAANWLAPLLRHRTRLDELKERLLVVQFGGAAGTLAALGDAGLAVQEALAAELDLAVPLLPWHNQRDNLAELAGLLSLISGSLAKMAQDIILLAQSEVGEVHESADVSRGGSSTMPQKRNPVISELIIAIARTNASHLASMHHALIHEQERATHAWQMEWLALPQMFGLTAAALDKARFLSENLVVNQERMQQNVAASNGLMLAEAASFALAEHLPRVEAKKRVGDAVQVVLAEKRHLADVLQERIDASDAPVDWEKFYDEAAFLGATEALIDRVLQAGRELEE